MKKLLALLILIPASTLALSTSIPVEHPYAAWQGVAKIGNYYYISSDRDESFKLRNSISVYTDNGFIKRKFYDFTDYSWGDINYTKGGLFGTLYNYNAGGRPYHSKVYKIDPNTLEIIGKWSIGGSVAETAVWHKDYWWVGYHNRKLIRRFSTGFTSPKDYPITDPFPNSARTQGMFFLNGLLYIQRHGPNSFGLTPSPGMDRYWFKNGGYIYKDTIKPMTYGTGQGVEYVDGIVIQNDRPANTIEQITLTELLP